MRSADLTGSTAHFFPDFALVHHQIFITLHSIYTHTMTPPSPCLPGDGDDGGGGGGATQRCSRKPTTLAKCVEAYFMVFVVYAETSVFQTKNSFSSFIFRYTGLLNCYCYICFSYRTGQLAHKLIDRQFFSCNC